MTESIREIAKYQSSSTVYERQHYDSNGLIAVLPTVRDYDASKVIDDKDSTTDYAEEYNLDKPKINGKKDPKNGMVLVLHEWLLHNALREFWCR